MKANKIIKVILITSAIILSIIVVSLLILYRNLVVYSPYYAKNIEHRQSMEPELMVLISDLEKIYPEEIKGIQYDYDGYANINNTGSVNGGSFSRDRDGYIFFDKNDVCYLFNERFELTGALDKDYNEIPISRVNRNKVISDIHDTVDPVLESIGEPIINLQWLFNYMHGEDFK